MSRVCALTQEECFAALDAGYILENEHGYRVWLSPDTGKQYITNKNRRKRRRGNYFYKFDYPTWYTVGRLSLVDRIRLAIKKFIGRFK
jgi:hypothetical protein